MFWSVGWALLWAGGFFCNLDILYGGLGIGKLQFLIKKKIIFFFSCYFFCNFWSLKPWIRIGSRSGSVLASIRIHWIRIRKKWIRIRNTGCQTPSSGPSPGLFLVQICLPLAMVTMLARQTLNVGIHTGCRVSQMCICPGKWSFSVSAAERS